MEPNGHPPNGHPPLVYLALPTYDGQINTGLAIALLNDAPRHHYHLRTLSSSLLVRGFNTLWCEALNRGDDYFLMVHSDVYPISPDWIQTLLDERTAAGADALGVVLPIKDDQGLTSTALTRRGNSNQRRLTLREAKELPETFGAADLAALFGEPAEGAQLLVNTGMLLVDLQTHRAEIERLFFRMRDVVEKRDDGKFYTWAWSEDWYWSRDAQELGLKLCATRKVKAMHKGASDFCNCCAWGEHEHDPEAAFIPDAELTYGR